MTRDRIGKKLKRVDLLTRKDVLNVQRSFKIESRDGIRHKNDAVSVDLWVSQFCNDNEKIPVLYYKKQGEKKEDLEESDFCLIIMNHYQQEMLMKFGKNIVAIDSTHGLNNYDFLMTTLMVVDEFGEGFPVTYMFSNRHDTHTIILFF
ncbi:hypothetical protein NQ314_002086 [Rhamnusium bicolor]|uniref:ZSWIM1/3 RNaseH-like domain-containing protein n=1 Tax=Rhamnusium bicolor TaxID=1586634 RepID=A0AAV8ZT63_9CUCU|nr:hypothetical protein NQ314_002086 [Rhamnusium bicolor]